MRREWLEEAQNARETIAKLDAERESYLQENKLLRTKLEEVGRSDGATAGQQADDATRREWLEEARNARETIAKLEAERVSYLQENKLLRTQLEEVERFDGATAGQQADEGCKWISYFVTSPHSCLPVSLTNTDVQAEVNPQPKVRFVPSGYICSPADVEHIS